MAAGIVSWGAYLPYWRLERGSIGTAFGTKPGRGTRAVASYDDERDRFSAIVLACAKLGLDAQRLELAKDQATRIFAAFSQACDDANLTPEQLAALRVRFAAALSDGPLMLEPA